MSPAVPICLSHTIYDGLPATLLHSVSRLELVCWQVPQHSAEAGWTCFPATSVAFCPTRMKWLVAKFCRFLSNEFRLVLQQPCSGLSHISWSLSTGTTFCSLLLTNLNLFASNSCRVLSNENEPVSQQLLRQLSRRVSWFGSTFSRVLSNKSELAYHQRLQHSVPTSLLAILQGYVHMQTNFCRSLANELLQESG
jgi:hypothetical protein